MPFECEKPLPSFIFMITIWSFFAFILAWPLNLHAQQLPPVTGAAYDGFEITWDELPGAAGYNIHGENFVYLDTVRGSTSYKPIVSGRHYIVAFDDAGAYSPIEIIEDDIVPTSNSVFVDLPTDNVNPFQNIKGIVYSASAGEIFWDRAADAALDYEVFLNDVFISSSQGTSFFIDSLLPKTENLVFVIAIDKEGEIAATADLLFDTGLPAFPAPAINLSPDPDAAPSPPENARLDVYSDSAAEIFWDRPSSDQMVVQTEVSRDGIAIGSTVGNSFFDDTREPGTVYTYRLVAINATGNRSEPAIVNPGPLDGPLEETTTRVLQSISEVTRNNPHLQWFPFLRGLTRSALPEDLTLTSNETVFENGFMISRSEFSCDPGTLTIENVMTRFGAHTLTFNSCNIDGAFFDGGVGITGTDIGGHNTRYDGLLIFSSDPDTGTTLDGLVSVTVFRSNNGMVMNYEQFVFSVISLEDEPLEDTNTSVELNQRLTDITSAFVDSRNTVSTDFTVTAPWTFGRPLTVTTLREFSGADVGNGNPITGSLAVTTNNENVLQIDADTGDDYTFLATVITPERVESLVGTWNDLNRLPCVSFTLDEEAIPGCLGIAEANGFR